MTSFSQARVAAVMFLTLLAAVNASAQIARRGAGTLVLGANAKGTVNLPYHPRETDAFGNQWYIYQGGWFRQQGNMPVYSEGAMMLINGNQPSMNTNTGRLDDSGELVIENMPVPNMQGCTVTRRIMVNREDGFIRIIDVFKNAGNQEQTIPLMYRSSVNYGINSAQPVPDPKRQGQSMGMVVTDGQGRCVLELFSGKGSKLAAQVNAQQNNNWIQSSFSLALPAGKETAILHLHAVTSSADAASKMVAGLKESKLLADVSKPIRKLIANFAGGNMFIGDGDIEILRGEAFDAAELRSGDQIRGTLKDPSYKLTTFYGVIDLPADKVIALVNVGDSRPRQLLVTVDGQIFGGKLEKDTIDLELSSGQVTKLPLAQVTRLGYRKRPAEPEEWTFDKPTVLLRSGERIAVQMPSEPIAVHTRYGQLDLKPSVIASIAFQNDENGVHEIYLTDGSKFAGLVGGESFNMKLADSQAQAVTFPASTIAKLVLTSKVTDPDESTPVLKLANEDQLVAAISGQYKLATAFDTLNLRGDQIKSITHSKTSPLDVVVRLWDETSVSGQLEEPELACLLKSGVSVKVPVALVAEYTQPQPKVADAMVDKVKPVVERLNADDWKARDEAQKQLMAMGPSIAPILKDLRNDQPPEAQQRIDDVLQSFKKGKVAPASAAPEN
jgi:hypothetical protein